MEWRDGVQIIGTPLWCDARRAREACFISSALVPEAGRHRQVIATAETLALLPEASRQPLAVTYGRPFTLGDARLELFPSGVIPGAASLAIELRGTRLVYAGTVGARGNAALGGRVPEVRSCDALVIDAMFGAPHFKFPAPTRVLDDLRGWLRTTLAAGATPVLLATPLAEGALLLRALADEFPLRVHRAFVDAAKRLRSIGAPVTPSQAATSSSLPVPRRFSGTPAHGDVVLWPMGHQRATAVASLRRPRTALVSGCAAEPDAAFPVSCSTDHDGLLDYIAQTGARRVYLLNGDALVASLSRRTIEVYPLGPPQQLKLF